MHLKDILHKKQKLDSTAPSSDIPQVQLDPLFTIVRSDSATEEVLHLPGVGEAPRAQDLPTSLSPPTSPPGGGNGGLDSGNEKQSRWRRLSATSLRSGGGSGDGKGEKRRLKSPASDASPAREHRLSSMFHRGSLSARGSRSSRSPSPSLPDELENIEDGEGSGARDADEREAMWEKRATMLAAQGGGAAGVPAYAAGARADAGPESSLELPRGSQSLELPGTGPAHGRPRSISDAQSDDDIQKAIQLHESGDLEQSTAMFGRLADPKGTNNALSQVLYGLALRHGWGIPPDPQKGVSYLSLAARNSAAVESAALNSGLKKGGAAKGELVLAIYELANCYRMGLGIGRDDAAARRYFETAARLGDVDAMEETARCYEEGIGGKKDKLKAATYYRLAEEGGRPIVGNSWIWKEKYDPQPAK